MRFPWLLIAVCSLGACTYISPEYEVELLGNLDEDGDGCPKKGVNADCDDNNPDACLPRVDPRFVEIPYDGIDNDCSSNLGLLDQVDIDGDGVPGIDYDEWLANGADPGAWPSEADKTPGLVDCRDVTPDEVENYQWINADGEEYIPESHTGAVDIHELSDGDPDNDSPYDGIDSNCNRDNDFDNDGDGYVPPETDLIVAEGPNEGVTYGDALKAYIAEWEYSHLVEQYGDCGGDVDPDVNPSIDSSLDEWYDGEDKDCAGNNDFDQDGDNFTPEVDANGDLIDSKYNTFLAKYHPNGAPWESTVNAGGERDCNDLLDTVYPGATDSWYDGLDSDCGQDHDFDQDGDGTIDQVGNAKWCNKPQDYVDYYNSWAFQGGQATGVPGIADIPLDASSFSPPFDGSALEFICAPSTPVADFDCEPLQANFYPGATEILGDSFDGDCDGEPDRTPMHGDPKTVETWTNAGDVVLSMDDEHYLLSTTAEAVLFEGAPDTQDFIGVTLYFDSNAGFSADAKGTIPRPNGNCTASISTSLDVVTTTDGLVLTNGCHDSSKAWLVLDKYSWSGSNYVPEVSQEVRGNNVAFNYSSFDVELNSQEDAWYVWASGDPGALFAVGDFSTDPIDSMDTANTDPLGFIDLDQNLGLSCDTSACTPFELDLTAATFSTSSDISWLNYTPLSVSHHHDAITIANDDPAGVDIVVNGNLDAAFNGDAVTAADAIYVGNDLYAAAVIGDDVWISFPDSNGDYQQVNLGNGSFPDYEIDAPNDVAIFADSDKAVVAASNDNKVMWAFFDLP